MCVCLRACVACGERKEEEVQPPEETRPSGPQVKLVQDILRSTSFFYMFTFLKKAYKRCGPT